MALDGSHYHSLSTKVTAGGPALAQAGGVTVTHPRVAA